MEKKAQRMEEKAAPDKEKLLYLTQIRHLDEQLERRQRTSDELKRQNKDLVSQRKALELDMRDTAECLVYSVPAEQRKADELLELLERRREVDQREREALQLQLGRQRQQLQEHVDKLNTEVTMQAAKIQDQKEEQMQLSQRLLSMECPEEQLETWKQEQKAAIKELELEIKEQTQRALKEHSEIIDGQIKTAVTAAVQEERARHSELFGKVHALLQENVDLMDEKDGLKCRQAELRFAIDKTRTDLNRAAVDVSNLTTEQEKVLKRSQQQKVKPRKSVISQEPTEDDVRQRLASLSEERRQIMSEVVEVEAELQEKASRRRALERDLKEVVSLLRRIYTSSEKVSEAQPETRRMLEILESDEHTSGPTASSLVWSRCISDPENLGTDPLFLLARCRPGDLGLVPGPTWTRGADQFTGLHWLFKRKRFEYWLSTCINASDGASQWTDAEAAASTSTSTSTSTDG